MSNTLAKIEEDIADCEMMIRHWRSQEEFVKAHRYETMKDKLTELKTIYLEEHGSIEEDTTG